MVIAPCGATSTTVSQFSMSKQLHSGVEKQHFFSHGELFLLDLTVMPPLGLFFIDLGVVVCFVSPFLQL
jgi:hypothetical protein